MSIKVSEQLSLWDAHRRHHELRKELDNSFGPYRLVEVEGEEPPAIHRNFDCGNYDKCLSFASNNLWHSFTCGGCRKVPRNFLNKVPSEVTSV